MLLFLVILLSLLVVASTVNIAWFNVSIRRNNFVYDTRIRILHSNPGYYELLPSYDEMLKIKHWNRWTYEKWVEYVEDKLGIINVETKVVEVHES